jgi:hypothetical protein
MNKLAALALASAPLVISGCTTERLYENLNGVEPALIAEVFGQAGVMTPIEKQFAAETGSVDFFGASDRITVSDYGDQAIANMFVQDPERGRAYIDVEVINYDVMEPGVPYTVELQGDPENGYYDTGDVGEDEPSIRVYACPEDLTGPTGQSGNAQEITLTREETPTGDNVFVFDAQADNPRQELFLDGWFRSTPGGSNNF